MTHVRQAAEQCGLSPKFVAAAITGVVVYLITKLGLQVDPVIEQALNVIAMLFASYLAPPGDVLVEDGPGGDVNPDAGDVRPPA